MTSLTKSKGVVKCGIVPIPAFLDAEDVADVEPFPEAWRKVWRDGIAPELQDGQLAYLHYALLRDDSRLIQGATTSPPPLKCVEDHLACGVCILGLAGVAIGYQTVGQVDAWFARLSERVGKRLGEMTSISWFLNWADDVPRAVLRKDLLAEIHREQMQRAGLLGTPDARPAA